jgi:hypothetical protein
MYTHEEISIHTTILGHNKDPEEGEINLTRVKKVKEVL